MMKLLRRSRDLGIGGLLARWYNKNTKQHRMAEMKGYAEEVASHIQNGAFVLEVGPGPGYLSIELAKLGGYKITGMDISQDFVEIARRNAKEADVTVDFQQGNVSEIPFMENKFNFIICTAAFKSFKEPVKALNEMYRVLKPGGTALIIDMNRNATDQQLLDFMNENGLKGLGKFRMNLTFKYLLRKGAYTKNNFMDLISKTSFKNYEIKEEAISLNVYLRKQLIFP